MPRIKLQDLLAGAQKLEDMVYTSPDSNRVFGSKAHQDTIDYLVTELEATNYYDVYKQEQIHLWTRSEQSLLINGENVDALAMSHSPSGYVTADLVLVSNLGCVAVGATRLQP